ncbi:MULTISPECIES: hypothetical protein [Methylobacterium]|jgi:hypothetical protein|uniref:Uncharacterized protein n=1 Tax=Methylobacterium aquaticum TaxID=270351 RepID=A0A0C6G0H5_9HYPH|nr:MULTISPECIES: hypothetical protein [Methylobacterium]NGM38958.1 hypothetical protein [Methylobacterium sp. DB0501]BAQ49225.1 hypothetical protein Maq22A_1p34840 [Methylobacterium aquaticum]
MATTTSAQCQSCRYYDYHKLNGGAAQGDEGLCRFNPPVSQPEPQGHGLWPVVSAQDWYGHFSPEAMAAE